MVCIPVVAVLLAVITGYLVIKWSCSAVIWVIFLSFCSNCFELIVGISAMYSDGIRDLQQNLFPYRRYFVSDSVTSTWNSCCLYFRNRYLLSLDMAYDLNVAYILRGCGQIRNLSLKEENSSISRYLWLYSSIYTRSYYGNNSNFSQVPFATVDATFAAYD